MERLKTVHELLLDLAAAQGIALTVPQERQCLLRKEIVPQLPDGGKWELFPFGSPNPNVFERCWESELTEENRPRFYGFTRDVRDLPGGGVA